MKTNKQLTMNREIKFRGKRLDNGEWAYGNVQVPKPPFAKWFMWDNNQVEVDPSTVGQYTGLKDRNGREIYEGDVALQIDGERYSIYFNSGCFRAQNRQTLEEYTIDEFYRKKCFEVIGNIHDHTELLG